MANNDLRDGNQSQILQAQRELNAADLAAQEFDARQSQEELTAARVAQEAGIIADAAAKSAEQQLNLSEPVDPAQGGHFDFATLMMPGLFAANALHLGQDADERNQIEANYREDFKHSGAALFSGNAVEGEGLHQDVQRLKLNKKLSTGGEAFTHGFTEGKSDKDDRLLNRQQMMQQQLQMYNDNMEALYAQIDAWESEIVTINAEIDHINNTLLPQALKDQEAARQATKDAEAAVRDAEDNVDDIVTNGHVIAGQILDKEAELTDATTERDAAQDGATAARQRADLLQTAAQEAEENTVTISRDDGSEARTKWTGPTGLLVEGTDGTWHRATDAESDQHDHRVLQGYGTSAYEASHAHNVAGQAEQEAVAKETELTQRNEKVLAIAGELNDLNGKFEVNEETLEDARRQLAEAKAALIAAGKSEAAADLEVKRLADKVTTLEATKIDITKKIDSARTFAEKEVNTPEEIAAWNTAYENKEYLLNDSEQLSAYRADDTGWLNDYDYDFDFGEDIGWIDTGDACVVLPSDPLDNNAKPLDFLAPAPWVSDAAPEATSSNDFEFPDGVMTIDIDGETMMIGQNVIRDDYVAIDKNGVEHELSVTQRMNTYSKDLFGGNTYEEYLKAHPDAPTARVTLQDLEAQENTSQTQIGIISSDGVATLHKNGENFGTGWNEAEGTYGIDNDGTHFVLTEQEQEQIRQKVDSGAIHPSQVHQQETGAISSEPDATSPSINTDGVMTIEVDGQDMIVAVSNDDDYVAVDSEGNVHELSVFQRAQLSALDVMGDTLNELNTDTDLSINKGSRLSASAEGTGVISPTFNISADGSDISVNDPIPTAPAVAPNQPQAAM